MRGILEEARVDLMGRTLTLRWQGPIESPKLRGAARLHEPEEKSRSSTSGNFSGSRRNASSISSSICVRAGRERSSRMMRSHSASPPNSGNKSGILCSSLLRSAGGKDRIASSISRAVLISKSIKTNQALARISWRCVSYSHLRSSDDRRFIDEMIYKQIETVNEWPLVGRPSVSPQHV